MDPDSEVHHCIICKELATKYCEKCEVAWYCSPECQTADLAAHRLLCETIHGFLTPPTRGMCRAIYFPAEETNPKFVWVGGDETVEKILEIDPVHGQGTEPIWCRANDIQNRNLRCELTMEYRSGFTFDGSTRNMSVSRAAQGQTPYMWRGNLIVYRSNYGDMDFEDYRNAVDWFEAYSDGTLRNAMNGRGVPKIKGVKIASEQSARTGTPKYIAVDIPHQHPVFNTKTSEISEKIGFPIKSMKEPLEISHTSATPLRNHQASSLHLNCDPHSENLGNPPSVWAHDVGDVIVVRPDGKDLLPHHVEALAEFFYHHIQPQLSRFTAIGPRLPPPTRTWTSETATQEISEDSFSKYFDEYRERKQDQDPTWANFPNPYANVEEEPDSDDGYYEEEIKKPSYIELLAYRSSARFE